MVQHGLTRFSMVHAGVTRLTGPTTNIKVILPATFVRKETELSKTYIAGLARSKWRLPEPKVVSSAM